MRVRFGSQSSAENPVTGFLSTMMITGTGYLDQEVKYFEEIRCTISRIPRVNYCPLWCSTVWRSVVESFENDSCIKQWLASNRQLCFLTSGLFQYLILLTACEPHVMLID